MYSVFVAIITGLALPQGLEDWALIPRLLIEVCALLLLLVTVRVFNRRQGSGVLILALMSFAWSEASLWRASANPLDSAHDGAAFWLHAEIVELPDVRDNSVRLRLKVSPKIPGVPELLSVNAKPGAWMAGSSGMFEVRLKPLHSVRNFLGFDAESWAHANHIGAQGSVLQVRSLVTSPLCLHGMIVQLRDRIRAHFNALLGQHPTRPILIALSVGDQSEVVDTDWTLLWRTGVGHLVSISGVHVTLFAELLRIITERLWRLSATACRQLSAKRLGRVVAFLGAWAYALVAGFSIPTQRTFFMQMALLIAHFLGREFDGIVIWLFALSATLLLDPLAIHSPSLWLSFAAVGSLILSDWGTFGRRGYWASEWHAQWVVNLALLPLICLWFQQVSLVSPLANFIAIPWVGYLVTPMTLVSIIPGLGFIAALAADWMACLMTLLEFLQRPVWAAIDLPAPGVAALLLGSLSVILLLIPIGWRLKPWISIGLLPLLIPPSTSPETGQARIEVLDVGQGLSILVETKNHQLLYDTGPRVRHWSAGARIIAPLLKAEGIHALDRIVLSHPDMDHVGGYEDLKGLFPGHQLDAGFLKDGAHPCVRGERWTWDEVRFQYLYPNEAATAQPQNSHVRNNHACVLEIETGDHRLLIPADIEAEAEAELSPTLRPSDVVIAPHHGSQTSSTPSFVNALKPHYLVISAGFRNHFHHPNAEVVARWQAVGSEVWRTDEKGAIRIDLSPQGVKLTHARGREYSPEEN